nr:MAG TPA: hypothetical protein [Caudoviricetes sp.]
MPEASVTTPNPPAASIQDNCFRVIDSNFPITRFYVSSSINNFPSSLPETPIHDSILGFTPSPLYLTMALVYMSPSKPIVLLTHLEDLSFLTYRPFRDTLFRTSLFFIKRLPAGFTKNYKSTMVIQFEKNVR